MAVAVAAVVALPGVAAAHPGEGSVGPSAATPPPNTTLTKAPERVAITFDAPLADVEDHGLTVTSPSGKTVSNGAVSRHDDATSRPSSSQPAEPSSSWPGQAQSAFVAISEPLDRP